MLSSRNGVLRPERVGRRSQGGPRETPKKRPARSHSIRKPAPDRSRLLAIAPLPPARDGRPAHAPRPDSPPPSARHRAPTLQRAHRAPPAPRKPRSPSNAPASWRAPISPSVRGKPGSPRAAGAPIGFPPPPARTPAPRRLPAAHPIGDRFGRLRGRNGTHTGRRRAARSGAEPAGRPGPTGRCPPSSGACARSRRQRPGRHPRT